MEAPLPQPVHDGVGGEVASGYGWVDFVCCLCESALVLLDPVGDGVLDLGAQDTVETGVFLLDQRYEAVVDLLIEVNIDSFFAFGNLRHALTNTRY